MVVKNKYDLTFGSDPEFFAIYQTPNGEFYCEPPAIFREFYGVETDNTDPKHPVFLRDSGVTLMEDGAAFELTIPPTKSPRELFDAIAHGVSLTKQFLKEFTEDGEPSYEVYVKPVVPFPIHRFNPETVDDSMWAAMEFGCDPDDDAIQDGYLCEIIDVSTHSFRYGGGHFHIGGGDTEKNLIHKYTRPFIQLLAITLGNLSIANSEFPDLEKQRAYHYGQPGRFRKQPHGAEYRAVSNSWVQNLDTTERYFFAANLAFDLLNNPNKGKEFIDEYLSDTIDAIRNADVTACSGIVQKIGV